MKQPNLTAIRAQLPHGALARISEKTGIAYKSVSEFFTYGWHQKHSAAILEAAIQEIKDTIPNDEVMEEYEELGLTGGGRTVAKVRRKVQPRETGGGLSGFLLIAAAAVGLYFTIPEVKGFIDERLFGKKPEKLTPEEAVEAEVKKAQSTKKV